MTVASLLSCNIWMYVLIDDNRKAVKTYFCRKYSSLYTTA
jgi:hypothetical protein